uniref:polo kinase n=1 Tax=Strongyloides papillosus TaxID=174720 RepID=A0A0N5BIY7_STREA
MEDSGKFFEGIPKIFEDPRTRTQYCRGELLGSGTFGKFYLFTNLRTKEKCSGKVIIKSRLNYELNKINEEINIQMSLRHPNILRMFGYFDCSTYVCMTMELCDDTLKGVLERLEVLDEISSRFVIREIACGISYLHGKQLIHRDIKPDNIFLTKDINVKIGDFGIAIKHVDKAKKIEKACGTPEYLAPESLDGSGYTFGVDVWALGVTLYKMVVGHLPFDYTIGYELYEKIKNCDYHISSRVPLHTEDIVRILLTRDPDSRPAIDDVLKHDYLNPKRISKFHSRRYIYAIPFIKINSQKDLHGYNSMSRTKSENIPKKDCQLDPSHRIEDMFLKKFNINSSYGNKSIPYEKDELDVEEQSNYLLKDLHVRISALIDSSTPKELLPPFQIANALSSGNRSKYFVSRWINLSEDYGFAYKLSDSSVGVLYRDNTRLTADRTMKNFQYIDESSMREYFEYDKCPTGLDKKLKLLGYFKIYMDMGSLINLSLEGQEIGIVDDEIPILLKWKKHDGYICFLLSNGILQVDFFDSNTKVIVSTSTNSISFIDEDNRLKTYSIRKLYLIGLEEVMKKKIPYVKKVIEDWRSHKRKHKEDDSVVLAKKSNNSK